MTVTEVFKAKNPNLFIGQGLCSVLLHLPDAEPPQGVLEELGSTSLISGLLQLPGIDQGSAAVDQVVVQPHPVLIGHLERQEN